MAITDGYSRPVPVGGRPIPFSPVNQSTTTEGLPISKPTTTYSSAARVVQAYLDRANTGLTYYQAHEILVSQFGFSDNDATDALGVEAEIIVNPPSSSVKPGWIDPGLKPVNETPQGQPQDDSTVPAEEDRTKTQDRPWRESDWAMMILGGIALYWVGRKVVPSIRGG